MYLKLLLARTRWGDELTASDLAFLVDLTLLEVFQSSYLLPKTARLRSTLTLPRR